MVFVSVVDLLVVFGWGVLYCVRFLPSRWWVSVVSVTITAGAGSVALSVGLWAVADMIAIPDVLCTGLDAVVYAVVCEVGAFPS